MRTQEFRIAGDQRGRQTAVAAEQRRTIGISEHRFEKFGALDQTGFKLLPFGGSMMSGTWLSGHGRSMPAASSYTR